MRFLKGILFLFLGLFFSISAYAEDFTFTTNAFLDTGALPVLYTCDSRDVSPEFSWKNPPPKTQSFVLIASDPDAPGGTFYHWIVYNIPANTNELIEDIKTLPPGALIGKNGWQKKQYDGPCPPKGSVHTYLFTLYALSAPIKVPAGADGKTVLDSIQNIIIKKVQLSTVYSRWLK